MNVNHVHSHVSMDSFLKLFTFDTTGGRFTYFRIQEGKTCLLTIDEIGYLCEIKDNLENSLASERFDTQSTAWQLLRWFEKNSNPQDN